MRVRSGLVATLMLVSAGCGAAGQVGEPGGPVSDHQQPAAASAVTPAVEPSAPKSYDVGAGPAWDDAPAYSCLQACALLFGGTTDDWACSTSPTEVNHVAWYSKFGSSEACGPTGTPMPESYNPGGGYEEAEASAYVNDWCFAGEGSINYCHAWPVVVPPPPPPPPGDVGEVEPREPPECESSDDEPGTIKGHVQSRQHLPLPCRNPQRRVPPAPAHAGRH